MKKNAATNLRAMLGVKKDTKPAIHVSPSQQEQLDKEEAWLKTGQFDRLGKAMADHRTPTRDPLALFEQWYMGSAQCLGIPVGEMHTIIAGRQHCGKDFMAEQLRALSTQLRKDMHIPNPSIGHLVDRVMVGEAPQVVADIDFSKMEDKVTMQVVKGRLPGVSTMFYAPEAGALSVALRGVSLNEEFDYQVKKLRQAYRFGSCLLTQHCIGANRGIYNLAKAKGGNPVLAERIAVWWEEHKEAYALPAEITL